MKKVLVYFNGNFIKAAWMSPEDIETLKPVMDIVEVDHQEYVKRISDPYEEIAGKDSDSDEKVSQIMSTWKKNMEEIAKVK